MINGYEVLLEKYPDFKENQRTPNGIDLKLGAVYKMDGVGGLGIAAKEIPEYTEIEPQNVFINDQYALGWILKSRVPYILEVEDTIKISPDAIQTYYPRSTLLRCGCTLHTAVGDAGYNGKLSFLFVNYNSSYFILEKGVRFAQLVDHQLIGATKEYDGDYQNDKHKE